VRTWVTSPEQKLTFQQMERKPSSQGWKSSGSLTACLMSTPIESSENSLSHRFLQSSTMKSIPVWSKSRPSLRQRSHGVVKAVGKLYITQSCSMISPFRTRTFPVSLRGQIDWWRWYPHINSPVLARPAWERLANAATLVGLQANTPRTTAAPPKHACQDLSFWSQLKIP